ncbi:Cis-aconitate decarboxylase [Lecanosticta acicola]|uniref:Cis-aconitate decarboxylase n=1 Tax=Lecanosticta acicola TaxID=111012 RepID=A0AAI8Z203_9PEZI|nr:Cis-aconitate decarboxylase [Lecanosticta acicola]
MATIPAYEKGNIEKGAPAPPEIVAARSNDGEIASRMYDERPSLLTCLGVTPESFKQRTLADTHSQLNKTLTTRRLHLRVTGDRAIRHGRSVATHAQKITAKTIKKMHTKALAQFAATATTDQLTPELRNKVKEVLIDFIGVAAGALDNAESTDPIYKAIVALQGQGNTGNSTVIGKGKPHMLPQYAALLNSAFAHSLDFDDTHAESTLHAGVTAISAALTQAELLSGEATSERFMLAICVGYETVCRIGRELGFESYHRGFHNTATAGVFGAVATIAVLKKLSAETVGMAFGLAGSRAAGSMQYLDNGSWNKRLHPGFAVHDAYMCVGLAEAGVVGATKIIEGEMGFLKAYSPREPKDLERLVRDLGHEWIWRTSSLKPFPACRMTHVFIEMAGNLQSSRAITPEDIQGIRVTMSPTNYLLVGKHTPNKVHPQTTVDAQFSVYFQVANALLYGANTGIQAYHKLNDPGIAALSDRIIVETDADMSGFAGILAVGWTSGSMDKVQMEFPLGEVRHPFTRDKVDAKFRSLTVPVYGEQKANEVIRMIDDLEKHTVSDMLSLLQ